LSLSDKGRFFSLGDAVLDFFFASFFCIKAKEKKTSHYSLLINHLRSEKQGILEIRYSTCNIGSHGCTDSH
jgi:hypothetical protein